MSADTLADAAATYVRAHRVENQSWCLYSDRPVELTVVYLLWARTVGRAPLPVSDAPRAVVRALEGTARGHELFDRVRDGRVVAYGLRAAWRDAYAPHDLIA